MMLVGICFNAVTNTDSRISCRLILEISQKSNQTKNDSDGFVFKLRSQFSFTQYDRIIICLRAAQRRQQFIGKDTTLVLILWGEIVNYASHIIQCSNSRLDEVPNEEKLNVSHQISNIQHINVSFPFLFVFHLA